MDATTPLVVDATKRSVVTGPGGRVFASGVVLDGAFEIAELISEGALGQTYAAYDHLLRRPVAIKVAWPHGDAQVLRHEARVFARLHHAGLPQVFGYGAHDETEYIVMERLFGSTIAHHLELRAGRGYSAKETIDIVAAVADTLAVLHREGVVYRNVSPQAIVLATEGRVVLRDLGVVQHEGFGQLVSADHYRAPESVAGGSDSERSDLYALGMLAFELSTGRAPRRASSTAIELAATGLPQAAIKLIVDLLAEQPLERPDDAMAVAAAFRAALPSQIQAVERPVSVLIADDDADSRALIRTLIERIAPASRIHEARDGNEAMSVATTHHPELVVLDLEMPGANGVEVCMYLQGTPGLRDIQICVVSSFAAHHADLLLKLGVTDVIDKNEISSKLAPTVVELFRRVRPNQAPLSPRGTELVGGRYTLGPRLGEGGMGMVFEARHTGLGKVFALKMMSPSAGLDGAALTRFRIEAKLAAEISHPHIVSVFDFGEDPNLGPFMVMELVKGQVVVEEAKTKVTIPRALDLLTQIVDAIDHVHRHDIVHGDIKAENVMIVEETSSGHRRKIAKVVDFGLASRMGAKNSALGMISGTPHYLAPELVRGEPQTIASDIYAIGVLGYLLATGSLPFDGATLVELLDAHVEKPPESPSQRRGEPIGPALEALILRALAKDPKERHPTATALRRDLQAVMDVLGMSRRRPEVRRLASAAANPAIIAEDSHIAQAFVSYDGEIVQASSSYHRLGSSETFQVLLKDALQEVARTGEPNAFSALMANGVQGLVWVSPLQGPLEHDQVHVAAMLLKPPA